MYPPSTSTRPIATWRCETDGPLSLLCPLSSLFLLLPRGGVDDGRLLCRRYSESTVDAMYSASTRMYCPYSLLCADYLRGTFAACKWTWLIGGLVCTPPWRCCAVERGPRGTLRSTWDLGGPHVGQCQCTEYGMSKFIRSLVLLCTPTQHSHYLDTYGVLPLLPLLM